MFRIVEEPDDADVEALDFIGGMLAKLDAGTATRITIRQARALIAIAKSDVLGEQLSLTCLQLEVGQAPFRSVERLAKLELVDMEDSPDDRRNTLLSLTEKGRDFAVSLIAETSRDRVIPKRGRKS
jgi:DNA-binding MarR family transcriptional regulator